MRQRLAVNLGTSGVKAASKADRPVQGAEGLGANKAAVYKADEARVSGWASSIALTHCREQSDGKCPHLVSRAQGDSHAYSKGDLAEARELLTSLRNHGIQPTASELSKLSRLLRAFGQTSSPQ